MKHDDMFACSILHQLAVDEPVFHVSPWLVWYFHKCIILHANHLFSSSVILHRDTLDSQETFYSIDLIQQFI